MAIAEHHPGKVSKRNRGVLRMSHQQLHDFASTPRRSLPSRKDPRKPKRASGYGGKVFSEG